MNDTNGERPLAWVLAGTEVGMMIVNRFDRCMVGAGQGYGVGYQLLETGTFDAGELELCRLVLRARRANHGDGVVMIDGGANIGTHTVACARLCYDWGHVLAFEPQFQVFCALAGNVVLNNCYNAAPTWGALGAERGVMQVPVLDFTAEASYGSLGLRQRDGEAGDCGQAVDGSRTVEVSVFTVDELKLPRLDFLKLDVEGMEVEALQGAAETIQRCRPVMMVEVIKSDRVALEAVLHGYGYWTMPSGLNLIAVHESDPSITREDA